MIYKEHEGQPGQTLILRSAWIDSQVRGFSRAICAFGYERFKKNCNKMVSIFLLNLYHKQVNLSNVFLPRYKDQERIICCKHVGSYN